MRNFRICTSDLKHYLAIVEPACITEYVAPVIAAVKPYVYLAVFYLLYAAAVCKRHFYRGRVAFIYCNKRLVNAKLAAFLKRGPEHHPAVAPAPRLRPHGIAYVAAVGPELVGQKMPQLYQTHRRAVNIKKEHRLRHLEAVIYPGPQRIRAAAFKPYIFIFSIAQAVCVIH